MLFYVKWTFWAMVWLVIGAFLHYTLPQTDIVRIADTYEKRIDFGQNAFFWSSADSGNAAGSSRDVFFIQTLQAANGKPMVYRNEDTGWIWPPYFKFNTTNLQTEASDLRSTSETPKWVAVRHYGWRNELISIFPNAVSLKPVAGPDVTFTPWFNIIFLTFLFAIFWAIYVRVKRFFDNRVDPALEEVGDALDRMGEGTTAARGRIGRWFGGTRPGRK
jgi:hypothetical protein